MIEGQHIRIKIFYQKYVSLMYVIFRYIKCRTAVFVLYENIDQILLNKLHVPMHYKIGVTCVYNLDTCSILCCNNTTI